LGVSFEHKSAATYRHARRAAVAQKKMINFTAQHLSLLIAVKMIRIAFACFSINVLWAWEEKNAVGS
jgi:hypothetical protein